MKKRSKSILSVLLTLCMLLPLVQGMAFEGAATGETPIGMEYVSEADSLYDSEFYDSELYDSEIYDSELYDSELYEEFYYDYDDFEDYSDIARLREENPFFYLDPCEQVYFEVTFYDEFEDNAVIIVLDRDISRISSEKNRVFTAEDFRDVGALYVEDLMYLSAHCNVYAQQLWDAEQQLVLAEGIVSEEELHELRDELLEALEDLVFYAVESFHAVESFRAITTFSVESENQEVLQAYLEALEEAEENTMWNFDEFRRILLIRLDQNCRENVLHAIYLLQQREYINRAEPNLISVPDSVINPNDPYFRNGTQWALNRIGVPQAWGAIPNYPSGTSVVRVGIIGHGIDANHPELAGRVFAAACGSLREINTGHIIEGTTDQRGMGMGTQQAGIIGARGNNGIGIAGISWNVQLVSLGAHLTWSTAAHAAGVNTAAQMGIPILTRSFGIPAGNNHVLFHAVQAYRGLFVNGAGNDGRNMNSDPRFQGLSNVLIVGASDNNDNRRFYSNFGSTSVHLFAPSGVWTTVRDNRYGNYGGTSAATPHVAGVAALLLSRHPTATTAQLRQAIMNGVDRPSSLSGLSISNGRLNAHGALMAFPRTVTFNPQGGTWPTPAGGTANLTRTMSAAAANYSTVISQNGTSLLGPAQNAPTRAGFTFAGWFTAATGGTRVNHLTRVTPGAGEITLHARWTPITTGQTSVNYSAHIQEMGWQSQVSNGAMSGTIGQSLRMEALRINLTNRMWLGDIRYRTNVAGLGWQPWVQNDAISGTTGQSRAIQQIQIELTGNMALRYHVEYRTHVSEIGWQPWVRNGATSGNATAGRQVEAIEVRLVPQAQATRTVTFNPQGGTWPAPGSGTGNLARAMATTATNYSTVMNTNNLALLHGAQNPPTRAGFTFVGWFTAATGGTRVNHNTVVAAGTGAITLHAQWTPTTRTVTFNPQGGTWPAPGSGTGNLARSMATTATNYSTVMNTNNSGLLNAAQIAPRRNGFRFAGWFTAATGGTRVNHNTTVAAGTGNVTLHARWTPITNVNYSAHVQDIGWQNQVSNGAMSGTTGRSLRIEAFRVNLTGQTVAGAIRYRAHVQDIGWQDWRENNAIAGTTGQSRRVEAIQIQLTDRMAVHYHVEYRVNIQGIGWQAWQRDGATAGTTGQSRRIEAMEIRLIPR